MELTFFDDRLYTWANFALSDIHNRSYLVFDLEGTGIDYASEHIIQIGAVVVESQRIVKEQAFRSYVRSPKPVPQRISRLTGIRQQDVDQAPSFAEVFQQFSALAEGRLLVTQCGYEYDFLLLQRACERHRLQYRQPVMLDTKALFALLHPELDAIFSTDFLVSYYQIDTHEYQRHDALGDALLIAEILVHILAEYEQRGLQRIEVGAPLQIKRFVLPPLPPG